jgi:hypothetical protein
VRAAAEIVHGAVTAVEIVVAAGVLEAVDVVAGAVDVRAAVAEIAGVAGVLEVGAADGGTRTSLPRIYADHTDRARAINQEGPQKLAVFFVWAAFVRTI